MVTICEKLAKAKHLKFSTNVDPKKSETKCIVFAPHKKDRLNVAPIILNTDPLPWVEGVKHLGNILQSENTIQKYALGSHLNLFHHKKEFQYLLNQYGLFQMN